MLEYREYGESGRPVILLHGGPAAAGYLGALGRELADEYKVYEPFQRGSGAVPLTVERHIRDLAAFVDSLRLSDTPALVGHSWGAMLALAYGAAEPQSYRSLALIGCGTFDTQARAKLNEQIEARMSAELREKLERLADTIEDPDARLGEMGRLIAPIYGYREIPDSEADVARCDQKAHVETWEDMLVQQLAGVYPAAFAAIAAPAIMLHGADDPHPGRLIWEGLSVFMPDLRYAEFARCGHYPWREPEARTDFFRTLREWLRDN